MIFDFKMGRPFFLGAQEPVEVHTDHKNLQYFRQPQKISGRQARWTEYLQEFNYSIKHIPGHENTIANLLSCQSDLNKGVNTDKPWILLPDHLFSHKIYLPDNLE